MTASVEDLMTKIQAFGLACYQHESGAEQIAMQDEIRADLTTLAGTFPAPEGAQALLVQALEDIIEPFAYIERNLPEGYRLDGQAALQQINSREFYTRIAKEALAAHRAALATPQPLAVPSQSPAEGDALAPPNLALAEALEEYWDAAWQEGREDRRHDTEDGRAQKALTAVYSAIYATQPQPKGLSEAQEPKYTVTGDAIVNRASGEVIPADEPVFIFRARDWHAVNVLAGYAREVKDQAHAAAVWSRVEDFKRFWDVHPDRMKAPDTGAAT